MARGLRRTVVGVSSLLLAIAARPARAQNADSFFYSNEAALTAGAMVAVPADEAAAWYNPAGLGALHRSRLNVNGSVFGVRVRTGQSSLTTSVQGLSTSTPIGGTDFVSTPTAAAASFAVQRNFTLSGGTYTSAHDVMSVTGNSSVTGADGSTLTQKLQLISHLHKLHMGGAFGIDAGHGVRIGGAMYAVYATRDANAEYFLGFEGPSRREAVQLVATETNNSWGLQTTFGAQWDVTKRLHLGAHFRFPELGLSQSATFSLSTVAGSSDGILGFGAGQSRASGRMRWVDPARLFLGVAYDVSPRVRFAFDGDVSFALEENTWGVAQAATARARAGVLFKPAEILHFGLGAFVDPSSDRGAASGLDGNRVDYYGAAGGVILRTRLGKTEQAAVVTTCVAVRYAVGFGTGTTAVASDRGEASETRSVTIHDIMPYLGTSVGF